MEYIFSIANTHHTKFAQAIPGSATDCWNAESGGCLVSKNFQDSPSHRMFGTLNIDEKKIITQFGRKPLDESCKPN
jgi:hypothetical protein